MAGTFPNLASGSPARYPLRRAVTFRTEVLRFVSDAEQRWLRRVELAEFQLTYENITTADMQTLRTFFTSQKGAFDSTWTLILDGVTYNNMVFTHDEFSPTEFKKGRWRVTLQCRQVKV